MHADVWLDRWMSQGFKYLADTAEVKLSAKLKSGVKGLKNLVAIIKIQVDNTFDIFIFTSYFILIQISYVYVRAETFFFFYYEKVLFTISDTAFTTTALLCGIRKKYDL